MHLLDTTELDISPIAGGPITNLQMTVPIVMDRNNFSIETMKESAQAGSNQTLPMVGASKTKPAVNFSEKIAQHKIEQHDEVQQEAAVVNPTILLKETNEAMQGMAAAGQEPSPFSTENNFAAQLKAGMGVPGDSVADMMVTVEQ